MLRVNWPFFIPLSVSRFHKLQNLCFDSLIDHNLEFKTPAIQCDQEAYKCRKKKYSNAFLFTGTCTGWSNVERLHNRGSISTLLVFTPHFTIHIFYTHLHACRAYRVMLGFTSNLFCNIKINSSVKWIFALQNAPNPFVGISSIFQLGKWCL